MEGGLSLKEAASVELEPSQREQEASAPAIDGSREGRFLLYWITTTSISTSTSFTTTYFVSSAHCLPYDLPVDQYIYHMEVSRHNSGKVV